MQQIERITQSLCNAAVTKRGGNLKRQDKCDNLSAFCPVGAASGSGSGAGAGSLARSNKLAQIVSVAATATTTTNK